jgi:hypothetical protein
MAVRSGPSRRGCDHASPEVERLLPAGRRARAQRERCSTVVERQRRPGGDVCPLLHPAGRLCIKTCKFRLCRNCARRIPLTRRRNTDSEQPIAGESRRIRGAGVGGCQNRSARRGRRNCPCCLGMRDRRTCTRERETEASSHAGNMHNRRTAHPLPAPTLLGVAEIRHPDPPDPLSQPNGWDLLGFRRPPPIVKELG